MDKEIGNMASAITAAWLFTGMVAFGWFYAKDADFAKIAHEPRQRAHWPQVTSILPVHGDRSGRRAGNWRHGD